MSGWILPSTQTLIQARPPSIETTRLTPLKSTVTARVSDAVLPSGLDAVTVIAQRPAVSSNGVLNVPSSATGTVTGAGALGGAGAAAPPAGGVAGPEYAALTTTESAFVVLPWTGMAPFSKVALSAGWSTVRVGASMTRKGTVMNRLTAPSDSFWVSGSTAVTSNWLRPRRSSTLALQSPSASAVTLYGSRPGVAIEIVAPALDVPRRTYSVADS